MEQKDLSPTHGGASTPAPVDDATSRTSTTVSVARKPSPGARSRTAASALEPAVSAAALAVRAAAPVVPATTMTSIAAANVAEAILGSRNQMERVFAPVAAAAALTEIATPFAEIGRWHETLMGPWSNPVQSMMANTVGFSRMWQGQEALFRFAVPSLDWWDGLDLWPTDGLMTSMFRSLDVARPHLFDLSSTLDSLLSGTRWIESFGIDLWRDLRHAGARIAYWAVDGAYAAMARKDFPWLKEFIVGWLDAAPTVHRLEALVEALLEIDRSAYRPEDGHQLLDDLARLVRERTTVLRRVNEDVLGMRRGPGGTITDVGREDLVVAHHLGGLAAPLLEDGVLDRIEPDVDPRVVELVNTLPRRDRRIAMLKIATGCAWSQAAAHCGAPGAQGEVLRRRLRRHRAALPYTTDPWTDLAPASAAGTPTGRLRPDVVIIDGATGIYP